MEPEDESLQTHLLHDYTIAPAGSQVIYKLLLDSLRSKNIRLFKNLVEQSLKKQSFSIDINRPYPSRSDETCLDIACKNGLSEFVRFLLEKGAKVNKINEAHNRGPIHFATENGYVDTLAVLLDEPTINPNLEAGQQTALHMAVKKNDLNCAELLLEKGASPNIPNNKGLTALHMSAIKGQKNMVNLILQKSKHVLDLDNYKDYNNQTTRDVLQKTLPDIPLPSVQKRGVNVHDLKYYLNANDEAHFLKCLKFVQDDVVNNVAEDLIEMAVQRNFKDTVVALLERTKRCGCNLVKSANIAIQQGLPDILLQILNMDSEIDMNILLLNACMELGIPGKEGSENMPNHLECVKIILARDDVDVRCTDNKGNTPLHYAARANCREAVTLLLEKGSYIGHMNNFGIPPVADISVSTLSQYFDDCIQAKKERTNEYTIEFNYKCLMPHDSPYQEKNLIDHRKREMDIFRYIADNTSLKHLLKHPLPSSFLYLKWHKIRYLLFLNFAFYVLFYLFLNAYILHVTYIRDSKVVTNSSDSIDESIQSVSIDVLQILTVILFMIFALREILQLISSPCHYMSSFKKHWLKMILIFLTFAILCGADTQVAAITILLSAWELIMLIGQHPRMSTGIEMFKTVSRNFMRFLFLYSFLILAFAFAFFILFRDDNFPNPGYSLFKTIIMLTGEFNANDIPFISHPVLCYIVFVLFVFLVVIVLFNLLNGLAVSDTAKILEKAELVGLISRIHVLAYIENIAVSAPFIHGPHCCTCNGVLHNWKWNPFTFLGERILLFPKYLKNGKLSIKPYDSLEAFSNRMYYNEHSEENTKDKVFPTFKMDPSLIKQAKNILSKKHQESDAEKVIRELEAMKERLTLMEVSLNAIKQGIENNNFNVAKEDEN